MSSAASRESELEAIRGARAIDALCSGIDVAGELGLIRLARGSEMISSPGPVPIPADPKSDPGNSARERRKVVFKVLGSYDFRGEAGLGLDLTHRFSSEWRLQCILQAFDLREECFPFSLGGGDLLRHGVGFAPGLQL